VIHISSTAHGSEVEITGTPEELRLVRQTILDVSVGARPNASVRALAERDPSPYDTALAGMEIHLGDGGVIVSVIDGHVRVVGGREELGALASFFVVDNAAPRGEHAHYEYYEGNR
jgi:hypothetical protein